MAPLAERMAAVADAIEIELDRLLPPVAGAQARLHEAMRYAVLGGGKRLRPFLVVAGAELFAVPAPRALRVGVAIELIHGYSLVHDDLPAMDDALTRRGRPSVPPPVRRGDRDPGRRRPAEPGLRAPGRPRDPPQGCGALQPGAKARRAPPARSACAAAR